MVPIGKQRLMKGQEVGGLDPKGRNYSINFAPLLKFAQAQRDQVQQETVDLDNSASQPGETAQPSAAAESPQGATPDQSAVGAKPMQGQNPQQDQQNEVETHSEAVRLLNFWRNRIHNDKVNGYGLPAKFGMGDDGSITITFDFGRFLNFHGEIIDIGPTVQAAGNELIEAGFVPRNLDPDPSDNHKIQRDAEKYHQVFVLKPKTQKPEGSDIQQVSHRPKGSKTVARTGDGSESLGTAGMRKEHAFAGAANPMAPTMPEMYASRKDELVNTLRKIAGGKAGHTGIKTATKEPITMNEIVAEGKDALVANLKEILKGKK